MGEGFEEQGSYSRPSYPEPRNPFQPDQEVLEIDQGGDDSGSEVDQAAGPLEQYAIASLNLVAIISQTAVPRAMFVDPTGMGHFANEGDRVGEDGGVIREIRSGEVEIQHGEDRTNTRVVELREREIRTGRDDELTEEEREMLRELMDDDERREALEEELAGAEGEESSDGQAQQQSDDRFPGLAPPGAD